MESKVIDIPALKRLLVRLLDGMEQNMGSAVQISKNYYWAVPMGATYDMEMEPKNHDVGSLWDDIEFLELAYKSEGASNELLMEHITPILAYLAEKSQ